MPTSNVKSDAEGVAILRAALALFIGLFIGFVAVTFLSPLWETSGSRGEFAFRAVAATIICSVCGCFVALIAGAFAVPVFAVVALFVAFLAFVTSDDLPRGLLMMIVLPASTAIGLLVVRRKWPPSHVDKPLVAAAGLGAAAANPTEDPGPGRES